MVGAKGEREMIQVTQSLGDPATYSREVDALVEGSDAVGAGQLTVITRGEERVMREKGKAMSVVPAWKWFLNGESVAP